MTNNLMKIYISGKITGMEAEARELFNLAEAELRFRGFDPVNPMALNHEHDGSWHSYMRQDVKALCDCDAIYMLTNWADSKGAIIEHTIAMHLGISVLYESVERVGINCYCPAADTINDIVSVPAMRVRFYPTDTDETFDGTVIVEKQNFYVVIPDQNLQLTQKWNKKRCDVIR